MRLLPSFLGSYSLRFHQVRLADDFVWSALDDAACFGELGAHAHEVDVDVTRALAAFVDAPVQSYQQGVLQLTDDWAWMDDQCQTYQTISDCPLLQSPAAKMPGTFVLY